MDPTDQMEFAVLMLAGLLDPAVVALIDHMMSVVALIDQMMSYLSGPVEERTDLNVHD